MGFTSKPQNRKGGKIFFKEVAKRTAEMGNGKVQTYTSEEVQEKAKKHLETLRRKTKGQIIFAMFFKSPSVLND